MKNNELRNVSIFNGMLALVMVVAFGFTDDRLFLYLTIALFLLQSLALFLTLFNDESD